MTKPEILFETLYRSDEQSHVRYVKGERKLDPYFLYYLFREDGIWLSRTVGQPFLTLEEFHARIDLPTVMEDPDHDEPQDSHNELIYQSGKWEIREDAVFLTWYHSALEEEFRRWYFRIRTSEFMETDFSEVQLRAVLG